VEHDRLWNANLEHLRTSRPAEHLDAFLHRDWMRRFTDGQDSRGHPLFWQSLAALEKPA
jgi:hypothetical protein